MNELEKLEQYKVKLEEDLKNYDYSEEDKAVLKAERSYNAAKMEREQKKIPHDRIKKEIERVDQLIVDVKNIVSLESEEGNNEENDINSD
ncbi:MULTISPECIES: hypothetical protein [unclassified Breznakia]|uniref:hypothetical protein n=1 Tax=unclassified Breznakia TaxID=2623764 RepID=UPI00247346C8|nr:MULTISPECIES: hypothetical protein [unclassified Breznakia]MDH6367567.1 hypothetical protein [Breznakia sp. PH1-1]MDH6404639.1 hypothetical protein [Breznakia sp. PF1-11]MDH6412397.1 hypothetical protein [Breznakia sp. PFB1-11]MDH6414735.1 hypothetical protein [Breznakia sp. PFB1-14]MDH6417020.1 hypothetical protein [Breznakia sp. PFB1-4]